MYIPFCNLNDLFFYQSARHPIYIFNFIYYFPFVSIISSMFLSLVSFRFVWGFVFFLFAQATNRSLHPGVFQPLSPPFPFSTPVVFSSHRPFGFCWAGMRRGGEEGTGRLVFHLQLSVQMPGLFCRSTANASLAGCFKQGNLKQNNNKKKKVTLSVRGERGGRREAHTCRDTARAAGLWLLPPPPTSPGTPTRSSLSPTAACVGFPESSRARLLRGRPAWWLCAAGREHASLLFCYEHWSEVSRPSPTAVGCEGSEWEPDSCLLPGLGAPAGMSEPTGVRFPSCRKCHEH